MTKSITQSNNTTSIMAQNVALLATVKSSKNTALASYRDHLNTAVKAGELLGENALAECHAYHVSSGKVYGMVQEQVNKIVAAIVAGSTAQDAIDILIAQGEVFQQFGKADKLQEEADDKGMTITAWLEQANGNDIRRIESLERIKSYDALRRGVKEIMAVACFDAGLDHTYAFAKCRSPENGQYLEIIQLDYSEAIAKQIRISKQQEEQKAQRLADKTTALLEAAKDAQTEADSVAEDAQTNADTAAIAALAATPEAIQAAFEAEEAQIEADAVAAQKKVETEALEKKKEEAAKVVALQTLQTENAKKLEETAAVNKASKPKNKGNGKGSKEDAHTAGAAAAPRGLLARLVDLPQPEQLIFLTQLFAAEELHDQVVYALAITESKSNLTLIADVRDYDNQLAQLTSLPEDQRNAAQKAKIEELEGAKAKTVEVLTQQAAAARESLLTPAVKH